MPLTTEEIDRIRFEEILRAEIRAKIDEEAKSTKTKKPIWDFVNSTFGIWLLSAIFVSGAGAIFTQYQQENAEREKKIDTIEKLDLEIGYRFSQVLLRLYELSDKGAPMANLKTGKTETDVKKVLEILHESPSRSITTLYPEYDKLGLPSLLAELKRHTTDKGEREKIDHSLAALVGQNIENKDLSNLNSRAGLILDSLMLKRWKSAAFYFTDCPGSAPFC